MAVIDFPASPTLNQTFAAANGVTYIWNGTIWTTLGGPGGGTGEVTARTSAYTIPIAGSNTVVPFDVVTGGNAGLWWNTTTARYTPPAGKYFLAATFIAQAPSGGNGTATFALRKNGTIVLGVGTAGSGSALFNIPLAATAYVDANGSDFFDWIVNVTSGVAWGGSSFSAFPLTGMQGPSGTVAGTVAGDFCANQTTGLPTVNATAATLIPTQIQSGNSGGYYNTANGRYTPPAGRYYIYGTIVGSFVGGAAHIQMWLRKNGTVLVTGVNTQAATAYYGQPMVALTVDANGSDWFDIQGYSNSGTTQLYALVFGATPTLGMVGPPGPAGPANPSNVMRGFISGFAHSHAGGSSNLVVGAGSAADSTNSVWINGVSLAKALSVTWAAGNGVGGMGPGLTLAANTWYFPFAAIISGAADIFFDTTATPTHAPAGTTAYRRLRPIKTDGSSNVVAHTGKGDLVQWAAQVAEGNPNVSGTLTFIGVPPGIQTFWQGRAGGSAGAGSGWGVDLFTPGTTGSANYVVEAVGFGGISQAAAGTLSILTNTAQQIQAVFAGSISSLAYQTTGFIDDCGRFD